MIRLLQLSLRNNKTNPLNHIQLFFYKRQKNKLFQKTRAEKEPKITNKYNQPDMNSKRYSYKDQQRQLPNEQKERTEASRPLMKASFLQKLGQVIQPEYIGLIQQHINKQEVIIPQKTKSGHLQAFQIAKFILQLVIQLNIPTTDKICQFVMRGFFTSNLIFDLSHDYTKVDRRAIQFLKNQKDRVESFLKKSKIKIILSFFFYFKGISDRRNNLPAFRAIYPEYCSFLYPLLQKNFIQIDFSSEFGYEIMEILNRSIRRFINISEDIKLINSICSQVPFFQSTAMIKFVTSSSSLIYKADNQIIMSVLEVLAIDHFEQVELNQLTHIIQGLSKLAKKHADVNSKVEELLHIMIARIFNSIKKDGSLAHHKNIVFEILVELSKQTDLKQQQGEGLFLYINYLIQSLAKYTGKVLLRESNALFELLTTLISNKFINRKLFSSAFASMRKSFIRAKSKRKQLQNCYLEHLLSSNAYQKIQVFNGVHLLELSNKKLVTSIRQIQQLNDIQFTKSLFILLVSQQYNHPLVELKKQLPQHTYQEILTSINQALMNHQQISFYYQIFEEVLNIEQFSELSIDLIENLYLIQSVDKKQILQIFLNVVFVKIGRKGKKKVLGWTIFVLQHYINNNVHIMLKSMAFYHLIKIMVNYITNNTEINDNKINIYRLLSFIFEKPHSQLKMNAMIEQSVRHLNLLTENIERLSQMAYIYSFEKNLLRFKLDHFTPQNQVEYIYEKAANAYIKLQPLQKEIINKLHNRAYLPQGEVSQLNIIAFFMDPNMANILANQIDSVERIIRQSSEQHLAVYLYNFSTQPSAIKSTIFKLIWSEFTDRLSNYDNILCKDILLKYQNLSIEKDQYQQLLFKVIGYYSNMDLAVKDYHYALMQIIRNEYPSKDECPQMIKEYSSKMKQYIQNNLHRYCTPSVLLRHYLPLIQFGYQLTQKQINYLAQAYYQHELGFYLIIHHEEQLPRKQIQQMLNHYSRKLSEKHQTDLNQINDYIELKYPKVNLPHYLRWDKRKQLLKQIRNKQIRQLKVLNGFYPNLAYNKKYCYLANQKHLITFCDRKNRIFYQFIHKFFAIELQTKHLKVHIFDFKQFDQPNFLTNLQKLGIIQGQEMNPNLKYGYNEQEWQTDENAKSETER